MVSPRSRRLKLQNMSHSDTKSMLSPHFLHCVYSHWSAYLHKSFAFCAVDGVYHRLLSRTTMPVCYSLKFMVGICRDTQTIDKICRKSRHSSVQPVTLWSMFSWMTSRAVHGLMGNSYVYLFFFLTREIINLQRYIRKTNTLNTYI